MLFDTWKEKSKHNKLLELLLCNFAVESIVD